MSEEEQRALTFLRLAGVFYDDEPDDDEPELAQTLDMNDTFGWACTMGEKVPDASLVEVARLYKQYGYCGMVYWVSEQNNQVRSEFHDINRFIDFVRQEESIRRDCPDWNKRAYFKRSYTLGAGHE